MASSLVADGPEGDVNRDGGGGRKGKRAGATKADASDCFSFGIYLGAFRGPKRKVVSDPSRAYERCQRWQIRYMESILEVR